MKQENFLYSLFQKLSILSEYILKVLPCQKKQESETLFLYGIKESTFLLKWKLLEGLSNGNFYHSFQTDSLCTKLDGKESNKNGRFSYITTCKKIQMKASRVFF